MGRALVVDSRRLFAAADLILKLVESKEGIHAVIPMRMDDGPCGGPAVPPRPFTQTELVEAMSILIRMGFTGLGEGRA